MQERYCGRSAWFEELRKRRVAELKRELERSEDSIGSLQSKIESLIGERERGSSGSDCNTESTVPTGKAKPVESPIKERSKDALSAGSFTEDTVRDWSPKTEFLASVSAQENPIKTEKSDLPCEKEKVTFQDSKIGNGSLKKRRGKRKRKGTNEVKEASVGESDALSSANAVKIIEESTGGCDPTVGPSCEGSAGSIAGEEVDLVGILDSILELEYASVFQRRLERQKRGRYKKTIRRHVDFRTIRSGIRGGMITTAKELFRDLLLLCNNALVFYPKQSPQYKSAFSLRDSLTKRFRRILAQPKASVQCSAPTSSRDRLLTMSNPVKPRSARPCNRKVVGKAVAIVRKASESQAASSGNPCSAKLPEESKAKTPVRRQAKGGRKRPESPAKGGRKRVRRR